MSIHMVLFESSCAAPTSSQTFFRMLYQTDLACVIDDLASATLLHTLVASGFSVIPWGSTSNRESKGQTKGAASSMVPLNQAHSFGTGVNHMKVASAPA